MARTRRTQAIAAGGVVATRHDEVRAGRARVLTAALAAAAFTAAASGVTPVIATADAEARPAAASSVVHVDPTLHTTTAASATRVIVRGTPQALDAARAVISATGGVVGIALPIVDGFAASLTADGLAALETVDGLRSVTADTRVRFQDDPDPTLPPVDTIYPEVIGAPALYADGHDGTGVGIAIIDTGVTEMADLAGRVTDGANFSGEPDASDSYGHGTFIAGVAAGDGTASNGEHAGVAPGAHVIPVKIAGADGASDVSVVLAALQWVVSHRDSHDIDVLNLSFGTDSLTPSAHDPLNYAVQRAWNAGIVVVVAGGNLGDDPETITKPADDPYVITVGSVESNGTVTRIDDTMASFSSRGPTRVDGIEKPDIVGPGRSLVGLLAPGSTAEAAFPQAHLGNGYARASGTSFTAGVVAGAVALLLDANPDWTPDEVKGALLDSAAPGPVGDANVDGHGSLDVAAAYALQQPTPANAGLIPSDGTADWSLSRGGLNVSMQLEVGGVTTATDLVGGIDLTSQGTPFNAVEYRTSEWTEAGWHQSQFHSNSWSSNSWSSNSWYGSTWTSNSWTSNSWASNSWASNSWASNSWSSNSWSSMDWYSNSWSSNSWSSNSWSSNSWSSNSWSSNSWYSNSWYGCWC